MPEHPLNTILEERIGGKIINSVPLSGGGINRVLKIETSKGIYVLKTNNSPVALNMFKAEKKGLDELNKSNTFRIPKILEVGIEGDHAFLVMEYIASQQKSANYDIEFGRLLAKMHQTTADKFGFDSNNFIGSLAQYNGKRRLASQFYIEMRLEPQLKLATIKGFKFNTGRLFLNIADLIPEEPPALVHGDLWSGNAIPDSKGLPALIDPAVFYGQRETDIAMMLLFGGFSNRIIESYQESFPLAPGWEQRLDLWQLYYLLAHLNLFGSAYYNGVERIIKKYS